MTTKHLTGLLVLAAVLVWPRISQADIGDCSVNYLAPKEVVLGIQIHDNFKIVYDPSKPGYKATWGIIPLGAGTVGEAEFSGAPIHITGLKPSSSYLISVQGWSKRTKGGFLKLTRYRKVCSIVIHTKPVGPDFCPPAPWYNGPAAASWDGANCFIKKAPAGHEPFLYEGRYYITPKSTSDCPLGSFDGANCFVLEKPPGGFIWENGFYQPHGPNGTCPSGWSSDTANCFFAKAPWGTKAFIWSDNFYTTPLPSCPEGEFDSANCYLGVPPPGRKPFIYKGGFYFE